MEAEPAAQGIFICSVFSCWRNFSSRCHRANIYSTLFLLTCLPPFPQSAGLWQTLQVTVEMDSLEFRLSITSQFSPLQGTSLGRQVFSGGKRAVLDSKTTNSLSQQQLLARSHLQYLWVFSITGRRTGSRSSGSAQDGHRYQQQSTTPTSRGGHRYLSSPL